MRTDPGPPMKLGNIAGNYVHIIVWCKACQHQIEPDPAAMAAGYGGRDVGARLARAACMLLVRQPGYRDMVLTGTRR